MEHIVIIGGGIAGLSAAIALRKMGHSPQVYESAAVIKPVGAGIVLAFNAVRACGKLGIAEAAKQKGRLIERACITDSNGQILTSMDYQKHLPLFKEVSLAIHRPALHEVLLRELPPESVHLGKRVKLFEPHADHITLHFEDGQQLESRFVLAADGIHSVFRKQLLPNAQERYAGYTCWRGIGTLPASYPYPNEVIESWGDGQRIGIVPLAEGKVYWFAVKNAKEGDERMKKATKADLLGFFKGWNADYLSVIAATPDLAIFWNDLHDIAPISQFAFGRLLLLGDAAHATTPNMGQGGCQALEDAAVLLEVLQKEPVLEKAFLLFEKQRLARTAKIITTSRRIGQLAHGTPSWLCAARNWILKMTPEKATVKQLLWLNETGF